jgi:peptidoglycan/LPS O-acetylase OafA/YrhL
MNSTPSRRDLVGGNRLYGIELVRIAMALAIVVWHYQHLSFAAIPAIPFVRDQQPFYGALRWLYEHGAYRVPTFWCISGFIFYWLYRESIPARTVNGRDFLVLRVSRLLPMHWLTLLLVALLQGVYHRQTGHFFIYTHNDLLHFVMQVFLVSDWGFQAGYSFNGPIWAVSVEVLILLLFFALLRTLGGSARVVLAVLAVALSLHLWSPLKSPLVECAMYFFAGGLAALALGWHEALPRWRRPVYGLVVALSGASLWAWADAGLLTSLDMRPYLLLIYLPVLIFLIARPVKVPRAMTGPVRVFSNSTYAIYLIHFPLQLLLACLFTYTAQPVPFYSPWFFVVFMLGTVALSLGINRFYEQPVQAWLRRGARTSARPRLSAGHAQGG